MGNLKLINTSETFLILGNRRETAIRYTPGTSARINFQLLDANKEPINLSGCAVAFSAGKRRAAAPIIDNLQCDIGFNQMFPSGKGTAAVLLDKLEIPRGEYQFTVTVTDLESDLQIVFPNNRRERAGKLIVEEKI